MCDNEKSIHTFMVEANYLKILLHRSIVVVKRFKNSRRVVEIPTSKLKYKKIIKLLIDFYLDEK